MNVLKFGFSGYDHKENADIGEILNIAEKIGTKLTYTEFDTGGTYYDFAIHNDVMEEFSEKEKEPLPQFFKDVLIQSEELEEFEIKEKDNIYMIALEVYRLYVNKENQEKEEVWD